MYGLLVMIEAIRQVRGECDKRQVKDCEVALDAQGRLSVAFASPQRAVTPGQSLVLYLGEQCLGGAVIAATDAPLDSKPCPE